MLYTKLPEYDLFKNSKLWVDFDELHELGETPEEAEERRQDCLDLDWFELEDLELGNLDPDLDLEGKSPICFTSDAVILGYFFILRDTAVHDSYDRRNSHSDLLISSILIAFHRHMPLAFTYDADRDEHYWLGPRHYDDVIGEPLGHEPGWAEGLMEKQLAENRVNGSQAFY